MSAYREALDGRRGDEHFKYAFRPCVTVEMLLCSSIRRVKPSVCLRLTPSCHKPAYQYDLLISSSTLMMACRQRKPKQYEDMMLGEGLDGDFAHNKAGQQGRSARCATSCNAACQLISAQGILRESE